MPYKPSYSTLWDQGKPAIILQSYLEEVPRDDFTWLDVVQKQAQRVSSSEIVCRDDLFQLLEQLQNPASSLYLQALEIVMKTMLCYKAMKDLSKKPCITCVDRSTLLLDSERTRATQTTNSYAKVDRIPLLLVVFEAIDLATTTRPSISLFFRHLRSLNQGLVDTSIQISYMIAETMQSRRMPCFGREGFEYEIFGILRNRMVLGAHVAHAEAGLSSPTYLSSQYLHP